MGSGSRPPDQLRSYGYVARTLRTLWVKPIRNGAVCCHGRLHMMCTGWTVGGRLHRFVPTDKTGGS